MQSFYKQLGAGMLYAGAAIGVSHLVQSTRAGAQFGYMMAAFIALAHLFKYPFFRFGVQYAHLTGHSILSGYARLGKGALWLFIALTVSTMFTVIAAVTLVTAGIARNISGMSGTDTDWSMLILLLCSGLLWWGRYALLTHLMKWVMVLLSVFTVAAVVGSFFIEIPSVPNYTQMFDWTDAGHIAFLIAFIGWMPAPMDISVWHSVWTAQDLKYLGDKRPFMPGADFYTGFFGTAIMAFCFLVLGVRLFYGTGIQLESSSAAFAGQIIQLYTTVLGNGFFLIIASAALLTMFSTVLTCLDGFPRVLAEVRLMMYPQSSFTTHYRWMVIMLSAGAILILIFMAGSMRQMVDFATTISFLTTPAISAMNYRVFMCGESLKKYRPSGWYNIYIWISLAALTTFAIFYLYTIQNTF